MPKDMYAFLMCLCGDCVVLQILAGERPSLNIPMPSDVQPAFILLLQSAWSPEPADRPTMHGKRLLTVSTSVIVHVP